MTPVCPALSRTCLLSARQAGCSLCFALLGPAWCNAMQPRNRVRAFPFRSCISTYLPVPQTPASTATSNVVPLQGPPRPHPQPCALRFQPARSGTRARSRRSERARACASHDGEKTACSGRAGLAWHGMATVLVYSTGHVERPRAVDVPLSVASGTERGHGGSQLEVGPGHQPPGL